MKLVSSRFKNDDFAVIKNSKLVLKRKDKIDIPHDAERLQALISSYMPKIKIEQLLIEVDQMTGFAKNFVPIHGQKGRPRNFYKTLIASILAQATNIGFATMQDCTPDITAKMMRHITDTCMREATIKAANAELVNQHAQLDLSQNYGDDKISSSDGQRFIITASSILSSYYPRYAGYYDKMIEVYTHTSNQLSVIIIHKLFHVHLVNHFMLLMTYWITIRLQKDLLSTYLHYVICLASVLCQELKI